MNIDLEKVLLPTLNSILKQSGIAMLFCIAIGFALTRVYSDLAERNLLMVEISRDAAKESRGVRDSLESVERSLESVQVSLARLADRADREGLK